MLILNSFPSEQHGYMSYFVKLMRRSFSAALSGNSSEVIVVVVKKIAETGALLAAFVPFIMTLN